MKRSAKCSGPRTYIARRSSTTEPSPFVPHTSSINEKPGAESDRSIIRWSSGSAAHRWRMRACLSASRTAVFVSPRCSASRSSTG